jgi:hypothetical protein
VDSRNARCEFSPLSPLTFRRGALFRFSFHVFLPLCLGGLIYLLWRPSSLRMFGWLRAFGLYPSAVSFRAIAAPLFPYIPNWVVYSLPGGLWAYAMVAWIAIVWREDDRSVRFVWLGIAAVIGPLSELLQLWGLLPGVFDTLDLICYLVGGLAALAINMGRATRWTRDSYYLFWAYFSH